MKSIRFLNPTASAGCVLLLGAIAVALLMWAPKQWLDVLTAVGTVGAVIVALWATLWGRSLQEEQAKDRAGLYAAYIAAKLEHYVDALRGASSRTCFDDLVNHTPNFGRFKRELDGATTDISLDMLAHLIPVNGRAAHRLARGFALVEEVRRVVAMEAARENEAGAGYRVSNECTLKFGGQLDEAVDLIRVALGECHSLAAIYAKAPTAEELYGD